MNALKNKKVLFVIIISIVFTLFLVVFTLLLTPSVSSVSPEKGSKDVSLDTTIKITFNRKISDDTKKELKVSPDVKGQVNIENNKTLTFVPLEELSPDKEYTVRVTGPKGSWGLKGKDVAFTFRAVSLPKALKASPYSGEIGVKIGSKIIIDFDKPIDKNMIDVKIFPEVEIEIALDKNNTEFIISPKAALKKETYYSISIDKKTGSKTTDKTPENYGFNFLTELNIVPLTQKQQSSEAKKQDDYDELSKQYNQGL